MGHGAVSRLPPPLRTPDKQPAAAAPTPARLRVLRPAGPQPAGPARSWAAALSPATLHCERTGRRAVRSFPILLREKKKKKRIPEGGGVAGGQAGRGDLKPLRHPDWSGRRKGAWPLLTMRCEDPTTFQALRPRPRATPPPPAAASPVPRPHPLANYLKDHTPKLTLLPARGWGVPVQATLVWAKRAGSVLGGTGVTPGSLTWVGPGCLRFQAGTLLILLSLQGGTTGTV